MPSKRVPIEVETWTKKYDTKYEKNLVATLVITPRRNDFLLVSALKIGGKQAHKPDRFLESRQQVQDRRTGLARDGFVRTTKTIRVHEQEAPPAWER